ncbi:MAG: DsbA family oxidoreductase [Gammaproteobacteria bacterium]|nr:DsbA family oxidoreductase [Gammaproteobacteria bacterium]
MLIEIFSDVVCPWCYIGKRRLDMVMNSAAGEGVELAWRPYQLYPDLPAGGILREDLLRARHPGGDIDELKHKIPGRIRAEAEDVGLSFDFGAMEVMANTRPAHRLLSFIGTLSSELQHQLAEVLFRYNFCEGRNVGDLEVLVSAASELNLEAVSLESEAVRDYLCSDQGVDELVSDLDRAVDLGVSGVPCFLLGGSFQLPGAQTPEVIGQFVQRAKERLG